MFLCPLPLDLSPIPFPLFVVGGGGMHGLVFVLPVVALLLLLFFFLSLFWRSAECSEFRIESAQQRRCSAEGRRAGGRAGGWAGGCEAQSGLCLFYFSFILFPLPSLRELPRISYF